MLSIGLITSSQDALKYYEKDDYYLDKTDGGKAQGEWYGSAGRELALEGGVEPDAFVAVLDGNLPNGQVIGTSQGSDRKHTPAWDLTFSAPKSVSILAEIGRDERLLKAHEDAVKEALDWIETHAIGVRQRTSEGRLFRRTASLVAALFTHHTSRNQDPNLHTHSVVANATQKSAGLWASVHSKMLFDHKMAAGLVYRAGLARRVLELGYAIEQTHHDGRFEIEAVPKELVKAMSTRRQQIESVLERWGRNDPESAARATLVTRARKADTDLATLHAHWLELAKGRGFDIEALVEQARQSPAQPAPQGADVETALKDAIDRLSEAEAVFDHRDLVRYTLIGVLGRADVKAIEAAIRRAERDTRLYRADEGGHEKWTTPQAKEQERRILNAMRKGQGAMRPIAEADQIQQELNSAHLNDEQRPAVEFIATTSDQFVGLIGKPGTGKTSRVLNTVCKIAIRRGHEPLGMAQNANAARTLEDDAKIPAGTINKHLNRVGPDLAALRNAHPLRAMFIRYKYRKQLWIVDEATQMPNGLKRRLVFAAERLGVRVVSVGDPGQFGAIEAGKPFSRLIDEGMRHATLVDMQRTRNPIHRAALVDAQEGRVEAALIRLQSDIREVADRPARLAEILETWRGLPVEREATLLLTARNAEKRVLNEGVREILKEEGRITGSMSREQLIKIFSRRADRRNAGFYEPGWIVRFSRDVPSLGVKKNEYRQVNEINRQTNSIILGHYGDDKAPRVLWNPRKVGSSNKHATEIFKLEKTELAVGEPVRWSRNSTTPTGPINGQMLLVVSVGQDTTTFASHTGEIITMDHRPLEGRHWDHAYASTIFSAQGKTVPGALVNADSDVGELFSQKAFVVALSRHEERLKFFTDDVPKLTKTLRRHLGDKTSAIEALERSEQTLRALEESRRKEIDAAARERGSRSRAVTRDR